MRTGLKIFSATYLIGFIGLVALDLSTSRSKMTAVQRLIRFEDLCAYGACFVFPFIAAGIVTTVAVLMIAFLKWRKTKGR